MNQASESQVQPRDIQFEVGDLIISAQEWGVPGEFPIIASHGWLDNAASFDELAPRLENVHLIALDSVGHGLSSHRGRGSPYHIWQDVGEIFDIADQLGWERFALLGHSRGAVVSVLGAGTFPDRISHLALLDGIYPPTIPPEEAPQQLASSIIDIKRMRDRDFALYPDIDTAVLVRQRSALPISEAAARLLIRRGLKEVEGGYTWRSDPQLKVASGFKLSDEHVDAFIRRISARIKLVLTEQTVPRLNAHHREVIEQHSWMEVESLAGGHHLHMDAEPAAKLARILNRFFHQQ